MSNAATHLTPKPFLALEEARVHVGDANAALQRANDEIQRLERRAETLLLSDQEARDLLADYSVCELARQTFWEAHPEPYEQWNAETKAEYFTLTVQESNVRHKLRALGDVLQAARERMQTRIEAEAAKGAAA